MTMFLAGVLLGLGGSAHCAGMCGPLVLTLGRPAGARTGAARVAHAAAYHAGRGLMYVLLALPAALAGQLVAARGLGRALALGAAVLLAAFALGSWRPRAFGPIGARLSAYAARAASAAARWSRAQPRLGPVVLGAANGLMPCGLVYAAMATAAASGAVADAVWTMTGFAAGTSPALVALALSAGAVPVAVRARLRALAPIALLVTAALLAGRAISPAAHSSHAASAATHSGH